MKKEMNVKYLIIGNSAGGIGAAEAIREQDNNGSMVMVSDEIYAAYSRPLISKLLSGDKKLEDILFRPVDFYEKNNIELLAGKRVTGVDARGSTVSLEDGSHIKWQKLLIATGGKPVVPEIPGSGKKGVFNFLTASDALSISDYIGKGQKALVIGGGLIGLSLTEALLKRGLSVTIIEMKHKLLNTILDETGSDMVEEAIMPHGVEILVNRTVTGIQGGEVVEGVVMDNGGKIPCNLVIIAIGVTPRSELAINAGIKVNRGILVDSHMETDHKDIFACGDVVEAYDFIEGRNRVTPVWPNAYIGGRTAGLNMAGRRTEFPPCPVMNSLNYFGLDIATAGIVTPPPNSGYEVITRRTGDTYKKLVLKNDYVDGMVFINDIEKSGIVYGLMRERIKVSGFKPDILSPDFGIAYLPDDIRRSRLGTVPEAEPELSKVRHLVLSRG